MGQPAGSKKLNNINIQSYLVGFCLFNCYRFNSVIRREENITGDSGMLLQPHISPGSQVYQRLSCEWTIWPRSGMSIRVEVLYVNIYDTTHDCSVNHLQVCINGAIVFSWPSYFHL